MLSFALFRLPWYPCVNPVSPTASSSLPLCKRTTVRLRIAALCGLLCLLVSEVQAQGNQISFSHIIVRPGEERTIPLDGTFIDGLSGLVVTVLFNPSVIQVLTYRSSPWPRTLPCIIRSATAV